MRPLPPKHKCPECDRAHFDQAGSDAVAKHHYTCAECGQFVPYEYMLREEVWAATGLAYHDGVLHLECVEKRIGRELRLDDFSDKPKKDSHNINDAIRFGVRLGRP